MAIAPLLPYLLLLYSLALTARRLIHPLAYPIAFLAMFFAGSTNGMFMPERIDHHGWQLALLALSMAGIADPKRVRGGLAARDQLGALSLAIGLEMIIYLALAGAAMVLFWVDDAEEAPRLARLCVVADRRRRRSRFLVFASYDNRAAVCDALVAGLCVRRGARRGSDLRTGVAFAWRLEAAAGAGALVAGSRSRPFTPLFGPSACRSLSISRPRPTAVDEPRQGSAAGLPAWMANRVPDRCSTDQRHDRLALLAWAGRRDRSLLRRIIGVVVPGLAAAVLLLWQTRTGPAAQMMATIGAAALVWCLFPLFWRSRHHVDSSSRRVRGHHCRRGRSGTVRPQLHSRK